LRRRNQVRRPDIETPANIAAVFPLRAYQTRWIQDESRFKIAVKSARIGFSFATCLEAVLDCLKTPNTTWTVMSASKAQSVEFIETAEKFIELLGGVAQLAFDEDFYDEFGRIEAIEQRVTFPNGARIIALPANPRTARGYPGNAILDEFAHHEDSYAIWAAITRQVSLGHKVRVLSTPNGEQGKFFELCKDLGLTDGEPEHNFQSYKGWTCYWIDVEMAIADGCPINMQEMRDLIKDDDIVNQEFYCVFLQGSGAWIPLELILACQDKNATVDWPPNYMARGPLFGGIDVARSSDQTILVVKEKVVDVLWTRMILKLFNMPLTEQARVLTPYVQKTRLTAMDSTGMGIGLFDMLNESCGGHVMGVNFAGSSRLRKEAAAVRSLSTGRGATGDSVNMKSDLAIKLKKSMEDRRERLPEDMDLRTELQAIKRMPTASGVTFDAPRVAIETGVAGGKKQKGFAHADRFWAFALATYAGAGGVELGMRESAIKTTIRQTRGYM
jgi:phage FluMu gp28-like protein